MCKHFIILVLRSGRNPNEKVLIEWIKTKEGLKNIEMWIRNNIPFEMNHLVKSLN